MHRQFTALAVQHPPFELTGGLELANYDSAYYDGAPTAYEWQEKYSDEGDEDTLMTLIRMLRTLNSFSGSAFVA